MLDLGADANARKIPTGITTIYQDLKEYFASIRHHSTRHIHGVPALELLIWSSVQHGPETISRPRPANIAIARDLIRHSANVNARDENGDTSLTFAAEFKDWDFCTLLLESGANPNLYSPAEGAPLIRLIPNSWQRGCAQTALVMLMLQKGAVVNVQNELGESPLANAIGAGDIVVASLLIKHGANPNMRDIDGNSPLMNLIHAGYLYDSVKSPLVKFMLNSGADVNLQNKAGDSPLTNAVIAGDVSLVRALIVRGAKPNMRNKRGISPFDIAFGPYSRRFTNKQRSDMLGIFKKEPSL
jgi:ankyrin repeat protein